MNVSVPSAAVRCVWLLTLVATQVIAVGALAASAAGDDIELIGGREGGAYHLQLPGSGGVPPYRWEIAAGELPPGLELNHATGVLAGTFRKRGDYRFTLRLTDAQGQKTEGQVSLLVSLPLTGVIPLEVLTTALPVGIKGKPYSLKVALHGGVPPVSCAVSGTLPKGLQFDPRTCGIDGTPIEALTAAITILAKDSQESPVHVSRTLALTVAGEGVAWWWIVLATVGAGLLVLILLALILGTRCPYQDCARLFTTATDEPNERYCSKCNRKFKTIIVAS